MEEGTAGRSPSCRHCLSRPPSTSIHVRRPRLVGRKCQCSPPWDFRLPKYGERRPCTSGRCYFPFEIRGTDMRGVSPKHSGSAQCLCACACVCTWQARHPRNLALDGGLGWALFWPRSHFRVAIAALPRLVVCWQGYGSDGRVSVLTRVLEQTTKPFEASREDRRRGIER